MTNVNVDREILTGLALLEAENHGAEHAEALALDAMRDRLRCADFRRVYRGRPGCACGCRGRYSERRATIERVRAEMVRRFVEAEFEDGIASVQDDRQYLWAYTARAL